MFRTAPPFLLDKYHIRIFHHLWRQGTVPCLRYYLNLLERTVEDTCPYNIDYVIMQKPRRSSKRRGFLFAILFIVLSNKHIDGKALGAKVALVLGADVFRVHFAIM